MKNTYTITRSRRRTLALYVKPDGSVEVRAPLLLSKAAIERFVRSKANWIEKKQTQFAEKENAPPRKLPPLQYAPDEFEQTARELALLWGQKLGVTADYVGFRAMSSRWGSCTPKTRRIRINTALKYCSKECLEYIVVHELAHMRENNHSPRFWKLVKEALPDYKTREKTIKSLSWLLTVAF